MKHLVRGTYVRAGLPAVVPEETATNGVSSGALGPPCCEADAPRRVEITPGS